MVSKHSGIKGIFDTILVNRYKNLYKCCLAMNREHELKFKWKKVEKKIHLKKKLISSTLEDFLARVDFFRNFI